jgi:hypothetical protein
MTGPAASADFAGTGRTSEQHCVRVVLGFEGFSKTIFSLFSGESMGLGRVLWTGLLVDFHGAMKGLELCLDVVLHELLDDGRTLSVSPKKEQAEAYDCRDRVGMGG